MLRLALIDDEVLARKGLRQSLSGLPQVEIAWEAGSVAAAREKLSLDTPDALFLDIQMPGGDGFSLLDGLTSPPRVIFITAHAEFAVRAFDVQAVDYILKPVPKERLLAAISRLTGAGPTFLRGDRICFSTPQRTIVAKMESVEALLADGDFTRVRVTGEAELMIHRPIGEYERLLPCPPFLRVDRSVILNLDRIRLRERRSRNEEIVHLHGGWSPILLGRTGRARLLKALGAG